MNKKYKNATKSNTKNKKLQKEIHLIKSYKKEEKETKGNKK
jgi:hypothetical protein